MGDADRPGPAQIPEALFALMVQACMDHLGDADQAEGCCPRCCASCAAIRGLLDAGILDGAGRSAGLGSAWWDPIFRQVDRSWLGSAWRRESCHDDDPGFELP